MYPTLKTKIHKCCSFQIFVFYASEDEGVLYENKITFAVSYRVLHPDIESETIDKLKFFLEYDDAKKFAYEFYYLTINNYELAQKDKLHKLLFDK